MTSEPPPRINGGCVQENSASRARVFSVSKAATACGSKSDETVNVSSRVATFNRADVSNRPPPSSAEKFVTASSGACQNPLHATEPAFIFSESKFLSRAAQVSRYGCAFVQKSQDESRLVGAAAGAVRSALNRRSLASPHSVRARPASRYTVVSGRQSKRIKLACATSVAPETFPHGVCPAGAVTFRRQTNE